MPDVWEFTEPRDNTSSYADGTIVPHRSQRVLLNGMVVGELEVHMHRRRGRDGVVDVSFGVTSVVFGPPAGGS